MASKGRESQNIQDPESRTRLRKHLIDRARRSSGASSYSQSDEWEDPDSAGTYLGLWKRGAAIGVEIGAGVALFIAILVVLGHALDSNWMTGRYFGAQSVTFATTSSIVLLAIALLMLRGGEVSRGRRVTADVFALTVIAVSVGIGIDRIPGLELLDWPDSGFFRVPSAAPTVVLPLIALGLLAIDRGPPEYRWERWITPLIGLAILMALLSRGYQAQVLFTLSEPRFSMTGAIAMCGLALGFIFLRRDRGVAGFLLAAGPGPSMARLLAPVVALVPVIMAVGQGVAQRVTWHTRPLIRGLDELIVVVALAVIVTYASRRLQRYYGNWRQAIGELAEQANVLSAMTEGVAMVRLDDGEIVFANPQYDRMHGCALGGTVGMSIETFVPEVSEEEELRRERVGWELADRGSSVYESRVLRPDGSIIWCRANAILIDDAAHGPAMILVVSDVSAEHRARAESEDAELRFQQVFEQSPIGLCLVRDDGTFERVNHNFEEITGYSAEELYGMTFADITHPDDVDQDLEMSGAMFRGATEGFRMEKRYVRKDGEVVWVDLTVTMLTDSEGEPYIALSMVQDVTEHHELSRQLRHLADHDPLTGLYNRRRFEEELSAALESGKVDEDPLGVAVLIVDLDNFKFVNDNYGHSVGDRLIVRAGEVLKARLRSSDVLARQGGDEFMILLREIKSSSDAMRMAQDLVAEIMEKARIQGPGFLARATASIGLVVAEDLDAVDRETLIMQADIAMYEVKDSGRNGARLYNPTESSEVSRGIDWHDRIRDALDNDDFLLYGQPVVSLRGERIPRCELFVRLRDRNGSIVGPGTFLSVAERHNLVQEIDRWVIEQAIALLAQLGPASRLRLFVNLSGQSVGDLELLEFISTELIRMEVAPEALVFEVTETSAIGNIGRAQEFASSLSAIGCHLALDDFGAGFASFYYLKHIASSFVKIDGEFIRNLPSDPTNRLLVKALADITHGMGKRTVAEHVEDVHTLAMLDSYGVDFVQGRLLAEPKPIEEMDLTTVPQIPPLPQPAGH